MTTKNADSDQKKLREIVEKAPVTFGKLVQLGCDEQILGQLLLFLHRQESTLPSGRKIRHYVQDSHEVMLKGQDLKTARRNLAKAYGALQKLVNAMKPFLDAPVLNGFDPPL